MPRSGVGGSHHSSSHHSSSHHSSSHHSSSYHGSSYKSRSYSDNNGTRSGLQRYAYNDNGTTKYFDGTPGMKKVSGCLKAFIIIFFLPFLIPFFALLSFFGGNNATKLDTSSYDSGVVIEDPHGVFDNTDRLEDSLTAFYKKTGISPVVVTVDNSVWSADHSGSGQTQESIRDEYNDDLRDYAYDLYLDKFDDESHLLIVYSTDVQTPNLYDWYWHAIPGDDTEKLITDEILERFRTNTDAFLFSYDDPADGIARSVEDLTKDVKTGVSKSAFIFMLVADGLFAILIIFIIVKIFGKLKKFETATPVTASAGAGGTYTSDAPSVSPYADSQVPPVSSSPYGVPESTPAAPVMQPATPADSAASTPYGVPESAEPIRSSYDNAGSQPSSDIFAQRASQKYDSAYDEDDGKIGGLFSNIFKRTPTDEE